MSDDYEEVIEEYREELEALAESDNAANYVAQALLRVSD